MQRRVIHHTKVRASNALVSRHYTLVCGQGQNCIRLASVNDTSDCCGGELVMLEVQHFSSKSTIAVQDFGSSPAYRCDASAAPADGCRVNEPN